jgi:hypothetical protein
MPGRFNIKNKTKMPEKFSGEEKKSERQFLAI